MAVSKKPPYYFQAQLPSEVYIVCYTKEAKNALEDCPKDAVELLCKDVPNVWRVRPNACSFMSWDRLNNLLRNEPLPGDTYLECMGYGTDVKAFGIYPMKLMYTEPDPKGLPIPDKL